MTYLSNYIDLAFIICDLLAAHFLFLFSKRYMFGLYIDQIKNGHKYAASPSNLLIQGKDYIIPPLAVAMIYLFNPYSIINCVGYSTTVFVNLLLAIFFASLSYGEFFNKTLSSKIIYSYFSGNAIFGILSLVICTGQSFYFIILLSPLFLTVKAKKSTKFASFIIVAFLVSLGIFLYICKLIKGDWMFLESTYGFM